MPGLLTLPEEVLLHILEDVAEASSYCDVFFPECREVESPRNCYALRAHDNFPMQIYYPHSNTTRRYGLHIAPDAQWEHICDWLALNTTCSRMRRLGREAWYRGRRFAMSSSLPVRINGLGVDREWHAAYRPQSELLKISHTMELSRIKRVIFFDNYTYLASGLLSHPQRLNLFPELRHCTLLYGYSKVRLNKPELYYYLPGNRAYASLQDAVTGDVTKGEGEEDRERLAMVSELQGLLHRIGVSTKVHVDINFPRESDRKAQGTRSPHVLMERLRQQVWPLLRFRIQGIEGN